MVFFTDAATYGIYLPIVLLLLKESAPNKNNCPLHLRETFKRYRKIARDPTFFFFCVLALFYSITYTQSAMPFICYFTEPVGRLKLTGPELGLIWAANTWMIVFFQCLVVKLVEQSKQVYALFAGSLLVSISFQIISFTKTFFPLIGVLVIFTIGELIFSPIQTAVVSRLAPEASRGSYMGFFGLFGAIGYAVGPSIGCFIIDVFINPHTLWYFTTVLGIFVAMDYLAFGKIAKRKSIEADI